MDTEYRLRVFRDMIGSCHKLYLWTYSPDMHLLESNCPKQDLLNGFLSIGEQREVLQNSVEKHHHPTILTNAIGLMWVAVPEKEQESLKKIHVLGPFFIDAATAEQIERSLQELKLSMPLYRQTCAFLKELPTISLNRIFEYTIMMHYCITQEKITTSDIHYRKINRPEQEVSVETVSKIHGTYAAEQEMLRYVREGNLDYKNHMSKMGLIGNMGTLGNDAMRQFKNLILVCVTLFSRAAIEGGLSPEVSFTLTDHYFQSVEASSTLGELVEISHTMQEDFITRVHRCRYNSSVSKPIRSCIEYIDLHLEDNLSLEELAQIANYSEYYFSKRFKKEIGQTPKEYIRSHRIERAKHFLRTTTLSIQDICERLHFSSQSYFADAFRHAVGITPTEYREQNQP